MTPERREEIRRASKAHRAYFDDTIDVGFSAGGVVRGEAYVDLEPEELEVLVTAHERATTLEALVRRALKGPWREFPAEPNNGVSASCAACYGTAPGWKEPLLQIRHAPDCPRVAALAAVGG